MKNAALFTLVLLVILPGGYAQQKTRPAAPDAWRRFVPADKSFSILFPTTPTSNIPDEINFRGMMGNGLSEGYMSTQRDGIYLLLYRDYLAPLDERTQEAKYERMFWPLSPNRKVIAGSHRGIELSEDPSDGSPARSIYRVFIVDQRLFVLWAIVRWDPNSPGKNRRSKADADKFFNSFRVDKINPPMHPFSTLTELKPEGRLSDRMFSSPPLGLSLQIPAGWKSEITNPTAAVDVGERPSDPTEKLERILFVTASDGIAVFWITVEQREFVNSTLREYARNRTALIADSPPSRCVINGREFLMIEFSYNNADAGPLTVRRYYTEWKGHFLEIGMDYKKESDRDAMEHSLKTLVSRNGN